MPTTPWDMRVAMRALVLAALAFAVAWLITATTDEGGVAWGIRAGRTLPTAPLCAALGTAIALQQGRARGEVRALESLGRTPGQNAIASVAGGAFVALVAALLIAGATSIDVTGFFPATAHGVVFHYDGAAWSDHAHGMRVDADGAIASIPQDAAAIESLAALPKYGRAAAAVATALLGGALPLVAAHLLLTRPMAAARDARRSIYGSGAVWRALGVIFAAAALTIGLFHAAAAGRSSALWAPLPAAALLVGALVLYRAPR